jgi:hypothetical protein
MHAQQNESKKMINQDQDQEQDKARLRPLALTNKTWKYHIKTEAPSQ